jgi:hypothetical protein
VGASAGCPIFKLRQEGKKNPIEFQLNQFLSAEAFNSTQFSVVCSAPSESEQMDKGEEL